MVPLIILGVVALFVLFALGRTIRIVPQARAGVVERLGRYSRTHPGSRSSSRSSTASAR